MILLFSMSTAAGQVAYRVHAIDPCAPFVELDGVDGIANGDRLLLYQNQQRGSGQTPAGTWEVVRVDAVVSTLVFLVDPPESLFDLESGVQAVRVDTASLLRIDSSVTTKRFGLGVGGVRMFCADTIVVAATVEASGKGLPGGRRSISGWDTCLIVDSVPYLSGQSGEVGHGLRTRDITHAGRRAFFNGGGGGNARNAGGGGGANGGGGGTGGHQVSAYRTDPIGGLGGVPVETTLPVLGAGGGGGHQNDFLGSDGAAGGGVFILRCSVLVVARGGSLDVSGGPADMALNDGAGGGGAGGSVQLVVDTILGQLPIDISGGDGGSVLGEWYCYGPGGGGGGGRVIAPMHLLSHVDVRREGGSAGASIGVGPCESDRTYGATAGGIGVLVPPGRVPIQEEPCAPPDIIVRGGDASGEPGERVELPFEIEVRSPLTESLRLTLWVRTRASVLVPEGAYRWAGRHAAVRFHTIPLEEGPPRTITSTMASTCVLGDSSEIVIGIDSVLVDANRYSVSVQRTGTFSLENVCHAGGRVRLFDPWKLGRRQQVFDVLGRRIESSNLHSYQIIVPDSRGTRLIVPR